MRKFVSCVLMVMMMQWATAQSYHFSQFFSTPLLTNPAATGFTDGNYRVASNIRSQGLGGAPVFTGYLSADISPLRGRLPEGSKAGLGMYLMSDNAISSAVKTNSVGLSAAYNVGLDVYGERSFGLGVQATYNHRRLDYSKLSFENQFNSGGFNPALPIGEPLYAASNLFFDVNAGIMYSDMRAGKGFFAGFAVYNILAHTENLLESEYSVPVRYSMQAGTRLSVQENNSVYLSLTSMLQAKANELTLGGAYGVPLGDGGTDEIIGGAWYRFKDALIPYVGFQRSDFQVGLSYDYTVSSAKAGNAIRNGFELTLIYKGANKRELKTTIPWF